MPHKTGKIHLAYKSTHNLTCEKQVVLLMITDGEKWHYLAVTRLLGLLRGVTSNNNGDFYCLNCFCSYKTKYKFDFHKKVCENRDYCQVEMPNEDNKIIKYNQGKKSIKLLTKGVYPYEYIDNWERFNETSLPNKESFYSNLNMENIDDIDYRHGNNVFKRFKLKNLGEYHDLYVQSDTLLLADVFENFRNTCLKVYELDPAHFLSLPGLAWQACLRKTNIKLELLTDYDMLLMVEEGIRGGICHSIHRHAKANNKYMKNYDKNEESSYI